MDAETKKAVAEYKEWLARLRQKAGQYKESKNNWIEIPPIRTDKPNEKQKKILSYPDRMSKKRKAIIKKQKS